MEELVIKNYQYKYRPKANRKQYTILECKWSDFTESEKSEIYKEAEILYEKAKKTAANTGIARTPEKKYIDSLSGVMAEFATTKFFNEYLSSDWKAHRPIVTSTHNQVDIALKHKETNYKVEVRSSFVQNGIVFALYGVNKDGKYKDKTYFDVLGTYKQEAYKTNFESVKDLFMRVLFDIKGESSDGFKSDRQFYLDRKYFIDKYINKDEPFYIIGGMSGDAIIKQNYTKTLSPNDLSQYTKDIKLGEYNVSEISNISDVERFLSL